MRFFNLLALAALPLTALAAKKPTSSTFGTYYAKQAPIAVDESIYSDLTTTSRDYHFALILTARDAKYACAICRDFDPEWNLIARSWQKQDRKGDHKVLFGTIDFDSGRNVFMRLGLQTAPVLLLFPPTTGPNAKSDGQPARFEFHNPQTAEGINSWITRQLPADVQYPKVQRPFNWAKLGVTVTILLGLFTFATVAYPYILPIIQNRNLWAAVSLIAVLMFTSGHMYNHIRKVPYVSGNGKGGISYFAGGFQSQYGMETQIVAAMYAVLSFSTIALALKVPRMKDARAQQIAVIIWTSVIFGMYSFLMSIFRVKNGGYPFWLPPF